MTTPAIILCLLVAPLLLGRVVNRIAKRNGARTRLLGCLGIALVLCFTGIGHFIKSGSMAEMIPRWVPGRIPLVYVTGAIEYILAIAVLIPVIRTTAGATVIVLLLVFLPVNIYAAINHVGMGGHQWGPVYLLIRVPLQAILIGWTWWFAVHPTASDATGPGGSLP